MSKSYGNYVGITEPPGEMFGKLMSIPDPLILDYFKLCTNRTDAELARLKERLSAGENPRDIKAELAKDIITIYHSSREAEDAAAEFDRIFREKQVPDQMPEFQVPASGANVIDIIVTAGLLPSKSEARRKLQEGAVHLAGARVSDPALVVTVPASPVVLKVGKRRFLRLIRGSPA
jgi:tyrosyl-tRNA synthetase